MRFESCPPQDLETDLPGWTWDIVVFSSCHNCLYVNNSSQSFELIQKIRENVGKLQVGDTECNSTIGPLHAVDMVYKNRLPFLCEQNMISISWIVRIFLLQICEIFQL